MTQSPPCSPPPLALLSLEPSPDLDNPQDPLCGQPPACLWPPASSTMEPPEHKGHAPGHPQDTMTALQRPSAALHPGVG